MYFNKLILSTLYKNELKWFLFKLEWNVSQWNVSLSLKSASAVINSPVQIYIHCIDFCFGQHFIALFYRSIIIWSCLRLCSCFSGFQLDVAVELWFMNTAIYICRKRCLQKLSHEGLIFKCSNKLCAFPCAFTEIKQKTHVYNLLGGYNFLQIH